MCLVSVSKLNGTGDVSVSIAMKQMKRKAGNHFVSVFKNRSSWFVSFFAMYANRNTPKSPANVWIMVVSMLVLNPFCKVRLCGNFAYWY